MRYTICKIELENALSCLVVLNATGVRETCTLADLALCTFDIGEVRALDSRPNGADWQIKIREGGRRVPLCNTALAVSAGESRVFSPQDGLTHILNPRTGLSPNIGVTSQLNTHRPQSPMRSQPAST